MLNGEINVLSLLFFKRVNASQPNELTDDAYGERLIAAFITSSGVFVGVTGFIFKSSLPFTETFITAFFLIHFTITFVSPFFFPLIIIYLPFLEAFAIFLFLTDSFIFPFPKYFTLTLFPHFTDTFFFATLNDFAAQTLLPPSVHVINMAAVSIIAVPLIIFFIYSFLLSINYR